ncbi:MAG: hypothetical protein JWM11_1660 [Planctomycetaceae bacterium]|nr:hypothetical protein [Planctomycetaceae bacterium]
MTLTFNISPFAGATPVEFGMPRVKVLELLGMPSLASQNNDNWGPLFEINVGYTPDGVVNHIGLAPGELELFLIGKPLWTPNEQPDPNPTFLALDPEPLEHLGFLIFTRLGITTTGFHDDDPDDLSIVLYPKGKWEKYLLKAKRPDLKKYGR